MWRCCGQVVIVSFHSSFVSFGLEKKTSEKRTKIGVRFSCPRSAETRWPVNLRRASRFRISWLTKTSQDRGSQMLLLNKKHIKTVSISHIKKHQTLSYQICDCLKTANIPANSSFLRCVAACVCDDVRMSLWHLQANDSAGQLGLRLHVGWTRR